MRAYILKRLLLLPPTVFVVTVIVFFIMWIVPGDAAMMILAGAQGESGFSQEAVDQLREQLGLARPVYVQYADWIWQLLQGDLGVSIYHGSPIIDDLGSRFLVTLQLAIMAILISALVAIPVGVLSAVKQDTRLDYLVRLFTIAGIALPSFWVGILLLAALAYWIDWLPPLGFAILWEEPMKNLQQMIFPAMVLAYAELAFTARITRSTMLEVMREDYMRTARAKGLSELKVIARHALRNALLPVFTISGWQFARLMGGVVVIETIFVLPGIGDLLITSVQFRDYPAIQAIMVTVSALILSLNLIIDLLYGWLDPRIRYG